MYAIVCQSDLIKNIKLNEMYKVDGDYQFKINRLIDRKDKSNLMKQLFWRPNIVFSIIDKNTNYESGLFRSLLFTLNYKFTSNDSYDTFSLFCLNC